MRSRRTLRPRISSRRDPARGALIAVALVLAAAAALLRASRLGPSAGATAGPFLTLGAIVALGVAADRLGVFRWLAGTLVPNQGSAVAAFASVLAFTALVSASTNLDVAVVVAMPVGLRASARLRSGARWIAPAVAVTANATSFLLPTSNLTNLLILQRAPLPTIEFVRDSWLAWLLVTIPTVLLLAWLLARTHDDQISTEPSCRGARIGMLVDLVPMFVAATAARAILGSGLALHGSFLHQAAGDGVLAAGVNNLPAAAAVQVTAAGRWATIVGLAAGPNLVVWGSVATLICRRIAFDSGTDLRLRRFSVLGLSLLPLQLIAAWLGLHLTGAQ